jgi:hypothetical protein
VVGLDLLAGVRGLQTEATSDYQFLIAAIFVGYEMLVDVAGVLAWRMKPGEQMRQKAGDALSVLSDRAVSVPPVIGAGQPPEGEGS